MPLRSTRVRVSVSAALILSIYTAAVAACMPVNSISSGGAALWLRRHPAHRRGQRIWSGPAGHADGRRKHRDPETDHHARDLDTDPAAHAETYAHWRPTPVPYREYRVPDPDVLQIVPLSEAGQEPNGLAYSARDLHGPDAGVVGCGLADHHPGRTGAGHAGWDANAPADLRHNDRRRLVGWLHVRLLQSCVHLASWPPTS